jgi:sialate O-acetylesterase
MTYFSYFNLVRIKMKGLVYWVILVILIILLFDGCGKAYEPTEKIQLPTLFSDNMVLQAGKDIKIWGKIDPLKEVSAWIEGNEESAVSDSSGNFELLLSEMEYGGPYTLYVAGSDTVEINNVMIGEVWVCSGQSNMQWSVSQSNDAKSEIAAADFKNIRLFTVPRKVSDKPEEDCEGAWTECNPNTVGSFSAVGYYFGRELHRNLDVPIGLIHSSWGGTPIEAWMKYATLENDPDFAPILDRHKINMKEYPEKLKEYNEQVERIKSEGLQLPETHTDKGNKGIKKGWADKDFNDSKWSDVVLPGFIETFSEKKIDGAFWLRKNVDLP